MRSSEASGRRRSRSSEAKRRLRIAWAIVSLALACYGAWFAFRSGRDGAGIDFFQFWAGAKLAPKTESIYSEETRKQAAGEFLVRAQSEGSERMFRAAQARTEFEFFSTPFLYTCFAPLGFRYDLAL